LTSKALCRRFSSATQESERKLEDGAYEAIFKAQIQQFVKREDSYVSNKGKAYALLWQQCTRTMQDKIQARSDFSKSIENDPIKILNAIEEHALSYEEKKYDMSSVSNALRQLYSMIQTVLPSM
jgi:hypothetical protein